MALLKAHALNAAYVLERMPIHDEASFMKKVPPDIAANIIRVMDSLIVIKCSELMGPDTIGAIAKRLPLEIASMILKKTMCSAF